MLMHIMVRNFALIEKADIELGNGLNILTGETGAGKSILIDAVNVALGGKCSANMIRHGEDYAYVELVFFLADEKKLSCIKEKFDVESEDGTIILSRKIMKNRSVFKLNDKTVTASSVRQLTGYLMDLHGQHEHQSLLYKKKHLEILDLFAGESVKAVKNRLKSAYQDYCQAKKKLDTFTLVEEERLREIDFLQYEVNEIYQADLKPGEEEELALLWKRISNSRNIMESVEYAHELIGYDREHGAGNQISDALGKITDAMRYDEELSGIYNQLQDLEALLSDLNRDLSSYMDDISFDEETFREVSERLDLIRSLELKYGRNYDEVMEQLKRKELRIKELEYYDENRSAAIAECLRLKELTLSICGELSLLRHEAARPLIEKITSSLMDLNFLQVSFDIDIKETDSFDANGYDEAEFLLSTNPGLPLMPLGEVASGGELSRIMLAVKTVLADMDQVPTLIFDEIDTGISGRTAACVSDKLRVIAGSHQIICITHLPQIAAASDHHFMIEKGSDGNSSRTVIRLLSEEESVQELARILGGTSLTDAAMENARALKMRA